MRIIQFKRGGEPALAVRRFSFETLHWDRVADMRKLRQLRGSIDEGGREMFVLARIDFASKTSEFRLT